MAGHYPHPNYSSMSGMPIQPGPGQMHVAGQQQQPMQMPGPPQQQTQQVPLGPPQTNPQQVSQQAQQQQAEIDPIERFKHLLPRLKESLVRLFHVGGNLFYQNANQDETGVQMDNVTDKFEKCLEEFYSMCDQIEVYLRLAHEIIEQDRDSTRNTPTSISGNKIDGTQQAESQLYPQYLSTARAQISCAKEIRDLLHECLKNLPQEHSHP